MASPKLSSEDREYLLELIAAEYDTRTILHLLEEEEIPAITRQTLDSYRKRHGERIAEIRARRRDEALERGVADQAERIARLVRHADALERRKFQLDDKGRPRYEQAWRQTLRQIAEEKGELKKVLEHTGKITFAELARQFAEVGDGD